MRTISFTFLLFALLFSSSLFGQGNTQVEFGKNRVQFHQDFKEWMSYESQNFITYWYGEGRNVGQAAVQLAEYDFEYIQNILEHRMNDKIEIIVYTDLTDLKQSNIGSDETFVNAGGQTKIVGNKIFVHFDGNHQNLRKDIRAGIAEAYLNAMLFGSNLQEIVQNAVLMNLPEWFKIGLASYVGKEWSTETDNELRDIFINERYSSFDKFAEDHPRLAGHSMWYFIGQNYGKSTVANLLYLTRINRSIESGFLYVLGSSYGKTTESWFSYFQQRYKKEGEEMNKSEATEIAIKNRRKSPLGNLKISPDGKKIVYVSNEIGKYKVYIQDIESGKRHVIHKGGHRNPFQSTDYNYPLVAWNPNNQQVVIIYEKRDILKFLSYDVATKTDQVDDLSTQFQRVYSMDFINTSNLVFSAGVRGYSDLYIYKPASRQTEKLTNDFYDDLDPTFVKLRGKKGILFASNRLDTLLVSAKIDTILPINNFDLYYYDLESRSSKLFRVTNTPFANERHPIAVDSTWYTYLSDQSGVNNRYSGYLEDVLDFYEKVILLKDSTEIVLHQDSTLESLDTALIASTTLRPVMKTIGVNHPNTNYVYNLVNIHSAPRLKKGVELIKSNEKYLFYTFPLDPQSKTTPVLTRHQMQRQKIRTTKLTTNQNKSIEISLDPNLLEETGEEPIDVSDLPEEMQDTGKIDIDNYLFQSEFDEEEEAVTVTVEEDNESQLNLQRPSDPLPQSIVTADNAVIKFKGNRIIPYRLKFRTDNVTTQLDNSLLFGGLNTYAGVRQDNNATAPIIAPRNEFNNPPVGILLKGDVKDLFEDYIIEGGIRIPTTFKGAEYFVIVDDRKKRLDKRYAFYHSAIQESGDPSRGSTTSPTPRIQNVINLGYFEVRYPFDIFTSLRASSTLRLDRRIQLATEDITLNTPSENQQRIGAKLEYVFDNTLDVSLNIKNGTRYKAFAEVVKSFEVDVVGSNSKFQFAKGFMTVLGLDARHYQRLDKRSILAFRAAAATSFGSEKNLYILGGVDRWFFPKRNTITPYPMDDNYAYQTIATNLRGFKQNIRNGNSYAILNSELRVPIFNYFSRRIRSPFFRNFQLVGFFDVGTAWTGPTPFDQDNPLNTVSVGTPQQPVKVLVNYFRDPLVAGYGGGVRSVLFGYFIRFDVAWGIETRIVQDPVLYLSMGMDF